MYVHVRMQNILQGRVVYIYTHINVLENKRWVPGSEPGQQTARLSDQSKWKNPLGTEHMVFAAWGGFARGDGPVTIPVVCFWVKPLTLH